MSEGTKRANDACDKAWAVKDIMTMKLNAYEKTILEVGFSSLKNVTDLNI